MLQSHIGEGEPNVLIKDPLLGKNSWGKFEMKPKHVHQQTFGNSHPSIIIMKQKKTISFPLFIKNRKFAKWNRKQPL